MRKILTILLVFGLFAVAVACAFLGYRNYRLFVFSRGTSEASIRLDTPGTFAVTVNPPGRSLFRPGGVLQIFVSRDGTPVQVEDVELGRGSLRVTDHKGHVSLDQPLEELNVTYSGRGQYYSLMREFETSQGGPYQVDFEIIEPFGGLEGTSQRLVARHFVSGNERLIHFAQFGTAGLSGAALVFLVWRMCAANKALAQQP